MRPEQWLSVVVIAGMMAGFVWGRLRYDLVAAATLVVAIALGLVPAKEAFAGFADDIVIIVGSALIVSASISRSGLMEAGMRKALPGKAGPRLQLAVLVATCALLSAFIKNIGALAIMIPVAMQMARQSGVSPSMFLMPMAFASLLGGLMTLVGTSPNIIVSRVREELSGQPFGMFDYLPMGAALAAVGFVFLVLCHRLLPLRTRESPALNEALQIANYTTEAVARPGSAAIERSVSALQKPGDGAAMITAIIGADGRRRTPLPDARIREGDVLLMEGDHEALDRIVSQGDLAFARRSQGEAGDDASALGVVEAIVGEQSRLIGMSAKAAMLHAVSGLEILAVSRRGKRFTERLGEIALQIGDVVVLKGELARLPEMLREWDCLPLVERDLKLGTARRAWLPVGILLAAMAATATGAVPVALAFFSAALAIVITGSVPIREVYRHLDVPILVMLAALIPVSQSLERTGTTAVIGAWLSQAAAALPPEGAIALILVAAMAVTPFLNNAATVLVMAPIAASFADRLGFHPEPFLMAVAIGAGCDFLTPIGHQCNTLVMGPGGYRFGDYARLGFPLSCLVVLVSVPMLMRVWPPA